METNYVPNGSLPVSRQAPRAFAHLLYQNLQGRSCGSSDTNPVLPVVSATSLKPRHCVLRVVDNHSHLGEGGLYTKTSRADIIISYFEEEPRVFCITKHKGHGIFIVF